MSDPELTDQNRLAAIVRDVDNSIYGEPLQVRSEDYAALLFARGVRVSVPAAHPREPSEAAFQAARTEVAKLRMHLFGGEPDAFPEDDAHWTRLIVCAAYAAERAVDGLGHAPEGPWLIEQWGSPEQPGWRIYGRGHGDELRMSADSFSATEALAVRDALNRVAAPRSEEPR